MRNWYVDGFDAEAWDKLKETVRRGSFIDGNDVFGQIMCGAICFDLTLRDTEYVDHKCTEWLLCAEAFLLGEDTGYGYTLNGTPYDYGDCVVLEFSTRKGYAHTLYDFIMQIDKAVEDDKIWAKSADRTDITWRGLND